LLQGARLFLYLSVMKKGIIVKYSIVLLFFISCGKTTVHTSTNNSNLSLNFQEKALLGQWTYDSIITYKNGLRQSAYIYTNYSEQLLFQSTRYNDTLLDHVHYYSASPSQGNWRAKQMGKLYMRPFSSLGGTYYDVVSLATHTLWFGRRDELDSTLYTTSYLHK
jgi:hypothetical protein